MSATNFISHLCREEERVRSSVRTGIHYFGVAVLPIGVDAINFTLHLFREKKIVGNIIIKRMLEVLLN